MILIALVADFSQGKKKTKKRTKKDKNAPKRPQSAYILFSNERRASVRAQGLIFVEIARELARQWNALGIAEKQKYEEKARQAKALYSQQMAAYNAGLPVPATPAPAPAPVSVSMSVPAVSAPSSHSHSHVAAPAPAPAAAASDVSTGANWTCLLCGHINGSASASCQRCSFARNSTMPLMPVMPASMFAAVPGVSVPVAVSPAAAASVPAAPASASTWTCAVCTFINENAPAHQLACGMCASPRTSDAKPPIAQILAFAPAAVPPYSAPPALAKTASSASSTTASDEPLSSAAAERARYDALQARLEQLRSREECSICIERQRDTVLGCGHRVCGVCLADKRLTCCPICTSSITLRIRLFDLPTF